MPDFVTRRPLPISRAETFHAGYCGDEDQRVAELLRLAEKVDIPRSGPDQMAGKWIEAVRGDPAEHQGLRALLHEYDLSTDEGVALMCLAEALLRVPDAETADLLIRDKLLAFQWEEHLGQSSSLFVNAATWALLLSERLVESPAGDGLGAVLHRLAARLGEPVVRTAVRAIMAQLGETFVLGATLRDAFRRALAQAKQGYLHSFDMLGEAARTQADADSYQAAYLEAIRHAGRSRETDLRRRPGVSVKLSALHPRYEFSQRDRLLDELLPRLRSLCRAARDARISLTLDAEEAERLLLQIELLEAVGMDPEFSSWDGLGIAVQAYQKCALPLLDYLADWASDCGRRLQVRLVKGAYWDSEIKHGQQAGLPDFPVFTRKAATDLNYLLCARRLLASPDDFYPQFATHNAHTLATVLAMAGDGQALEFQRLHGMGEALYRQVRKDYPRLPCRIYAPVGSHDRLLAYLVRRLLENGANSSFVHRIQDPEIPLAELLRDPVSELRRVTPRRHPRIARPVDLFTDRRNSQGLDLAEPRALRKLAEAMRGALREPWRAAPIIDGDPVPGDPSTRLDPADNRRPIGQVVEAGADEVERALASVESVAADWEATPAAQRGSVLERIGELFEQHRAQLMTLLVREAGKTLPDALAEVREAVDFCRYYAVQARNRFSTPGFLPGPVGENNSLVLRGRGPFVCISPWNFPLAIFTGQITAALAAGNPVIAKPAEQTPLVASLAVRLMHQAGVPGKVLQLLPGSGETLGGLLVPDERVRGVAFTGSTEVARLLFRQLAQRPGPIVPLIAETGGLNAMIVDSTALPEQVTRDVIRSAFGGAGQRCSALRILCLQEEVAGEMLEMLGGAMAELRVGDPALLATDIGPVIDAEARTTLLEHYRTMDASARRLAETPLPDGIGPGHFVAPALFELTDFGQLEGEVFGPYLHCVRYRAEQLEELLDAINASGYGLTMGVHSRIDARVSLIRQRARVGNLYVNRNMIGAVVGCQPFGGLGLSGTGPKAGGPDYVARFAWEQTLSVDTTAAGGNASLFARGMDTD